MIILAMDRASVRNVDANGFLHVEVSNISKANVCPYYGSEIPDWEALGLDPERIYDLYRDPEELAAGAATFNNLPILCQHVPVSADDLPEELVIGSTGTDAVFEAPYLRNSLVIWPAQYQDAINSGRMKELSSAYRYRADMTPGNAGGLAYHGVMRDIIGNHVALVIEGRAGPDVVVGDEIMKLKSRTALMVSGALAALIRPKLAQDAKVDISDALAGVDAKSLAMDGAPKKLAVKIEKAVKPHLATDAALSADEIAAAVASIQPIALDEDMIDDEEKPAMDADDDDDDKDDIAADAGDDDDDDDKPAMDQATVSKMIKAAEKRTVERMAAIEQARRDVAPIVGEVVGMDSAAAIYKLALDAREIDLTDVPPAAYRSLFLALPKQTPVRHVIAQDAGMSKLSKALPNLPAVSRI